jgi:hypothetical protein
MWGFRSAGRGIRSSLAPAVVVIGGIDPSHNRAGPGYRRAFVECNFSLDAIHRTEIRHNPTKVK